ncbi:MAG: pyrimidine-nucleoside phosphorylase, partial [Acidobacteria bacterium]
IDTEEVGHAIAEAGGGRVRVEDKIDPAVGFVSEVKIGDEVRSSDMIGSVYCADLNRGQEAATRIRAAYEIADEPPRELPVLIREVIDK